MERESLMTISEVKKRAGNNPVIQKKPCGKTIWKTHKGVRNG